MLALFGNLSLLEIALVAVVALMIFGKRLPEVAVRTAAQVVRLRRSVAQMWREAGIDEEIRKVRRDIDRSVPRIPTFDQMVRDADRHRSPKPTYEIQPAAAGPAAEEQADPDSFAEDRGPNDSAHPESDGSSGANRREPDGELRDDGPSAAGPARRDEDAKESA